jgi:hypothetical protein
MNEDFIEAITEMVEAYDFCMRSMLEEFVRFQVNIMNLEWWEMEGD